MQKALDNMDLTVLAAAANIPVAELEKAAAIDKSVDVTDDEAVKAALPSARSHYLPLLNKVTQRSLKASARLTSQASMRETSFSAIILSRSPMRSYLASDKNANDPDSGYEGRAGIERQFEQILAGEDGKVLVLKDAKAKQSRRD